MRNAAVVVVAEDDVESALERRFNFFNAARTYVVLNVSCEPSTLGF